MKKKYIELSRKLLVNTYEEYQGANVVCSPFSFYILLGIAWSAVNGRCREEIVDILGDHAKEEDILAFMKNLQNNMTGKYKDGKFNSSNGICVKEDLYEDILDSFRKLMKKAFDAEFFSAGSDLVEKVNTWVNKKTEGMIPKLMDCAPGDIRILLMNAISFEAKWEKQYEQSAIEENSEFTNFDGTVSEVTMLYSKENEYIEDDFYTGFVKNYRGGKYAFMALLPKTGEASFYKEALGQLDFKEYYDKRMEAEVVARIPEFEISSDMELTDFCKKLGMQSVFLPDADFSGITTKEPLMVSAVVQKAYIKVDRAGTKAAAVSAICVMRACLPALEPKYVELDRPFVYAVMDKESALPVFCGVVNKLVR